MIQRTYVKACNLSLLLDQLLAGIASLRPVADAAGNLQAVMSVSGSPDGQSVTLGLPDNVDLVAVQAVIDAHTPSGKSVAEQIEADRSAATAKIKQRYSAAKTSLDSIVTDGAKYTDDEVRAALVNLADLVRDLLLLQKATPA